MDNSGFSEVIPVDAGVALPPKTHNVTGGLREGDALKLYLDETSEDVANRADALLDSEGRLPAIDGPEPESKATEYVKLIQACIKAADQKRLAEKGPYDLAANQVHQHFKKMMDGLDSLKKRVERKLTDYKVAVMRAEQAKREEEARLLRLAEQKRLAEAAAAQAAAEEAERKAAAARKPETRATGAAFAEAARVVADSTAKALEEAAATRAQAEQAAAVKPAELTRARGARGGVSSLSTFWNFRDMNREQLDLEALRAHIPTAALETAIRSYLKANQSRVEAGHQIKGLTFFQDHATRVS